ncbi:MAG: phosphopantothenoylcysteine decarboxylase [Calditrichaceae bacterium]|nr:phosphopantothenoylcysteine decarboxylase [Calditrichaceae bacterium]MBN2709923.1 phosphopantothenoylcysteine decarboxylase [Calditrichaceae bacterium]RQV92675.1 MAG: phosphopantothenoylcysteine decarboxylase [Calditrichota bacterium]
MIYIKDNCNGKLYYAWELFEYLTRSGKSACVLSSAYTKNCAHFLNHYDLPVMNNVTIKADDIVVEIIDNSSKINHSGATHKMLYYPVHFQKDDIELPFLYKIKDNVLITPVKPCSYDDDLFFADIQAAIELLQALETKHNLSGLNILVSAGPTAEDIDPVRFLTNRSSGKMGIALAKAAFNRGATVTLVCGPTCQPLPEYIKVIRVRSAVEMNEQIVSNFSSADIYIAAAAVADYTPNEKLHQKIKKKNQELHLQLKRTADILKSLAAVKKQQLLIGFSVETENEIENSRNKLINKHLDMIVINNPNVEGAAFAEDTNVVTIMDTNGNLEHLPKMTKYELSQNILNRIIKLKKR